jgi:parallel beta-helix repeat protein
LDVVNYITFDGLDIENVGTSSSNYLEQGFYLANANNISILNCGILLRNASNNYAISTGGTVNDLRIDNVNIEDAYFGIYVSGTVNRLLANNVSIKNAYYGYYWLGSGSNTGLGNTINKNSIDGVNTGIYTDYYYSSYNYYYCTLNDFTIKETKITNANTGIRLGLGNNQRVYNNVIHSQSYGIYFGGANTTDTTYLAHNTVYMPNNTATTYCLRKSSANGRLGLYNNIFINKSTSTGSRCFTNTTSDNSNILQESNNNIYYCEQGAIYNNSSVTKNTVAE